MININLLLDEPEFRILCEKALVKWGDLAQKTVAIEECAEFINECAKDHRKRTSNEKMIDEIADVIIMMNQMALLYGLDSVKERIKVKIDKIKKRLE